ncbi:MAG: phosphoglycerate kinase [Gemmatimonadales bacterium]|nr:MAG: phosphoglycerate kinase [Gemmatimonadales bacterium]
MAQRTRTLSDLEAAELRGRRVLVRVDYNVPLDDDRRITDPIRIEATLPTLRLLVDAGARVILVSHLGRPDGAPDPAGSLAPVAAWLEDATGWNVPLLTEAPGSSELATRVAGLEDGEVVLLENIRFFPGETSNDPAFGTALGELGDLFVGDAFGVAHRAHASNVGAPTVIRAGGGTAVAGRLMEREIRFLRDTLRSPVRPFVSVMGGAKISGKIDLIEAILPTVDRLLVGGAMANTFLRALGLDTGKSLVEEDRVQMAADLLERGGDKILLPVDVVVASEISPSAQTRIVDRDDVGTDDRIGDIGPATRALFASEIRGAGTVVWNGPMGVAELAPFAEGTFEIARILADATDQGTLSVVGGGDSAAAAEAAGVAARMTHISTGGGASLDLMAGKELPGVSVLEVVDEVADVDGDAPDDAPDEAPAQVRTGGSTDGGAR